MAALSRFAPLALLVASPARALGSPIDHWAAEIREASARFEIPQQWIREVMRLESGGRARLEGRPVRSRAGAMGLMQLMPATWAEMRAAYDLGDDPYDPRDNVLAGTAYLRAMYERFGYPGLFAAYNAGPGRYASYLGSGRALPEETVVYLARITSASRRRQALRVAIAPSAQRRGVRERPALFLFPHKRLGPGPTDGVAILFAIRH